MPSNVRESKTTEIVATSQSILVVGGGVSGMTAALEAAKCGKHVILAEVERVTTLEVAITDIERLPKLINDYADMIVTPCPLCQANVEVYQSEINRKQGTKFDMPVTYYSQLMAVAYGATPKQAGLDGHIIKPKKLQEIAVKVVPAKKA